MLAPVAWLWKSCDCVDSGVVDAFQDTSTGAVFCVPDRCPQCGEAFYVEAESIFPSGSAAPN